MKITINRERVKEAKEFIREYRKELFLSIFALLYAISCNLFFFLGGIAPETEFTRRVIIYFVYNIPFALIVLGAFGYLFVKMIVGIASFFEVKKSVGER